MLGSGGNSTRGNTVMPLEMPPLTQCLPLEPITLGNQKYTRSGELRRALGVPFGSTWEDHSVKATKPSPPVATEELKHLKESVQGSSNMARDRVKLLHENIFKLDKYKDTLISKKRQRSDHFISDRTGGTKLTKMGSQIHRNARDITQRFDERAKSVGLNKRARTLALDGRADVRPSTISRQQMVMEKDEDMLHAGGGVSVRPEEKIRRLPTGGEGWDKKIKKKRSVGSVGNRVLNAEREVKRTTHPKMIVDSKFRSCDAQGFRLKSSSGVGGINKLQDSFEPSSSNASTVFRNSPESDSLARDRTTVVDPRVVARGSNKSNIREDNPVRNPSTVIKAKICRAPRTGSVMALDSSPNLEISSGAQGWEEPTIINKVQASGEANNPKISIPTGSSSHPMAQWVRQRPHNNSRMRRSNLIPPVSNHVETQISSAGIAASDFSARTSSIETNASLLVSSVDNNLPNFKRKLVNVSSPVRLSESVESGAGEDRLKGKETHEGEVAAHKIGTFAQPARKIKVPTNDIGDGVRRQGRSGRCSSLTRPGIPLGREKLENLPTTKPLQSIRPSSDKSKSKSGRPPSKKLKDRKAVTRVGPMLNVGSSDYTGESDDDHEELYAAANSARNASNLACSGPFWKKMEPIFASVSSEDTSYLKQQLSFAEELDGGLSAVFGNEYKVLDVVHKEVPICSGKRQESRSNLESINTDASSGRCDPGKLDKVTPLYQRVLSALIEEDENEEFYHYNDGKSMALQYVSDDSHCGSCNHVDSEPKERDRMEYEVESRVNYQSQKNCLLDRFSCDKSVVSNPFRCSSTPNSLHSNEKWLGDDFSHSDVGPIREICQNVPNRVQPGELNVSGLSSSDSQYQLMRLDDRLLLELQSIGLYPETLPDLAEEEVINQDILELKEGLYQQIGRKNKKLGKIHTAIQTKRDEENRNMEQVAMDQLIEMAYRKRLACRGSNASKSAARKVSRQVALAFVKRSLARCRKFENTGSSCFGEPALRDVIFSASPSNYDAKSVDGVGSGTASNTYNEASNHQDEARGSGAVSSTLKGYGSHRDNVDRGSSDAREGAVCLSEEDFLKHQPVMKKGKKREVLIDDVVGSALSRLTPDLDCNVIGGVKGKRSERDRTSLDSFKGERKTKAKSKPKPKNSHLPASGNGCQGEGRFKEAGREGRPPAPLPNKEEEADFGNMQLHELDPIEVGLGGPQDLTSWLNFDEDGLQDHDSIGLEIPMDDLSELILM